VGDQLVNTWDLRLGSLLPLDLAVRRAPARATWT